MISTPRAVRRLRGGGPSVSWGSTRPRRAPITKNAPGPPVPATPPWRLPEAGRTPKPDGRWMRARRSPVCPGGRPIVGPGARFVKGRGRSTTEHHERDDDRREADAIEAERGDRPPPQPREQESDRGEPSECRDHEADADRDPL